MKNYKKILFLLVLMLLMSTVTACMSPSTEEVKTKIKEHLHKKYGKEFVVDRIGTRSSRGEEFYQARIYPKSIIGTNKEGDEYYYASATIDKLSFGRLDGVGDSYSYVSRNIDMENYLLPQAKKKFGERVLLKVDVEHKVTGDGSWWAGYKSKSLKELRKKVKNDPEHNRIELELDVYVFDRIESKKEKEKRRKDIFQFLQYLKEDRLFEYLEMRVVIMDERVLATSYDKFARKVYFADKVEKEIPEENTTVKLPPLKLRKEMSKQLQNEINNMSKKELLSNMGKIKKDELTSNEVGKWNAQYLARIYSPKMIKERYTSTYNQNPNIIKKFKDINDIGLAPILDFIYKLEEDKNEQ